MKIGYFVDMFPYQNPVTGKILKQSVPGGAGIVAYELAVQMARRGHEVYVFTTAHDEDSVSRYGNISIIRYKSNFKVGQGTIALKHLIQPIYSNFDLDIVHSHASGLPAPLGGAIYAKKKDVPFVITHHGDWIGGFGTLSRRVGIFLYNYFLSDWLFSKSDGVIALSKSHLDRSKILKKYQDKTSIIPNGVNIQNFQISQSQDECRRLLDLPTEKKIILFLGNVVTLKGPHILLDSMKIIQKRHPDTYLVVGGDGYLRRDLIKNTAERELKDNVVFTGYIPTDETPLYYNAADIFVLPSFSEAFPLTLLEAGAADLPVIATDVGGVSDILHDGINGLIVKTGDPNDLADKITILLDNDELRKEMGKKGQMFAEQYSWERVAEETEKLYLDLIRREEM